MFAKPRFRRAPSSLVAGGGRPRPAAWDQGSARFLRPFLRKAPISSSMPAPRRGEAVEGRPRRSGREICTRLTVVHAHGRARPRPGAHAGPARHAKPLVMNYGLEGHACLKGAQEGSRACTTGNPVQKFGAGRRPTAFSSRAGGGSGVGRVGAVGFWDTPTRRSPSSCGARRWSCAPSCRPS